MAYVGRAVFFIKERRIMFKTGDIIDGRYEIKEQIGAGGGGTVYKAYDKSMRMDVAIKLVKDLLLTSSELEVRTEVDLIKRLKHKYLPTVYNFVESDNAVYMVMEYIDGHDIKALSDMGRTFNEDTIIRCGIQICEALDELHSQKPPIIHGDIKPSNIMLTPADNICLIDFNISSVMKGNKAILHGYSKGYAAPEQTYTRNGYKQLVEKPVVDEYHEETRYLFDETAMGKTTMLDPAVISDGNAQGPAYIDVRTDIYGVGAVLYFMLTGYAPVGGNVDFTDIKVSKKLRNIILKAMAPQPYDRFMTAAEMKKALESDKPVAVPQRKKTAERTEKKMSADINLPDSEEKKLSPKTIRMCALSLCAVAVLFSVAIYGKNRADGDISVSQADTSTESLTETASAETTVTTVTSTVSETTTETTKVTTTMGEHPIWPNTNAPKNTSVTTTTGEHPIWPNTNAPKNTAAQTAAPATAKTTAQTTVPTTAKTTAKTMVVTTVPTTVKTTAATTVPTTAKTTAKTTTAKTTAKPAATTKVTSSGNETVKIGNKSYKTDITELDLSNQRLSDKELKNISNLPKLRKLNISGNKLSNLNVIGYHSEMVALDISSNPFNAKYNNCSISSYFPNLVLLNASDINSNSNGYFLDFGGCNKLTKLNIRNSNIQGYFEIKNNVTVLLISGVQEDYGPSFRNLKNISVLEADYDDFTGVDQMILLDRLIDSPLSVLYLKSNAKVEQARIDEMQQYVGDNFAIYLDDGDPLDERYTFPDVMSVY